MRRRKRGRTLSNTTVAQGARRHSHSGRTHRRPGQVKVKEVNEVKVQEVKVNEVKVKKVKVQEVKVQVEVDLTEEVPM